jgi:hypothetical protein
MDTLYCQYLRKFRCQSLHTPTNSVPSSLLHTPSLLSSFVFSHGSTSGPTPISFGSVTVKNLSSRLSPLVSVSLPPYSAGQVSSSTTAASSPSTPSFSGSFSPSLSHQATSPTNAGHSTSKGKSTPNGQDPSALTVVSVSRINSDAAGTSARTSRLPSVRLVMPGVFCRVVRRGTWILRGSC